jgi:CRISPR/Cas system CSM-associated protein Csm3 (group 7 of RAMP superfamily)
MGGVIVPQDNTFWNPYRWVPVSNQPVGRATPAYRHRWVGLGGRLECTLEALTPFLIGSSKNDGRFIRSKQTNQLFVPGTSLKGLIRSLAELIGNAGIPFPKGQADPGHTLQQTSSGDGLDWKLDIAARMFGYLNQGKVFAGLVHFSDGRLLGKATEIGPFKVVVGQPRPERHRPFYPDKSRRKFYHHHAGATELVRAPGNIIQTRAVYALAPGTKFAFTVDFENLGEQELALLVYCLVLEENATVTLGVPALGPNHHEAVTLTGPLRQKFGGCKPQGGGSVKFTIAKMELRQSMPDRYRAHAAPPRVVEGTELEAELRQRTQPIASRTDDTMRQLRAMLIYTESDPRRPVEYPDYGWFQDDKGIGKQLKPTS